MPYKLPAMCREDFDEEWIGAALARLRIPEDRSKCWGWSGAAKPNGYPQFPLWRARYFNGWKKKFGHPKLVRVHRLVYCVEVEPIKEGMVIDHLCNNPICCNPAHLQMTTQRNNVLRNHRTPAGQNVRKPVCPKCGGEWKERARVNGRFRGRRCQNCLNSYKRKARRTESV